MSAIGVKIDKLKVPICNSFKLKIIYDQLCYEMDPNKFIDHEKKMDSMQTGITLIISTNKDRQLDLMANDTHDSESFNLNSISWKRQIDENEAKVYLGTKGMLNKQFVFTLILKWLLVSHFYWFTDFLQLKIGYEYNLNVLTEIKTTDDFNGMAENVKGCDTEIQVQVNNEFEWF